MPTLIESTFYPAALAPLIEEIDLDAIAATPREAELLDLEPGAPLLRTVRRTTDPAGAVLECSIDLSPGQAIAFVVRNSLAAGGTSRVSARGEV